MMMEDETEVFKSDNPSDNLRKISSEAQKRKSTPAKGTYNPSTVGVLEQLASTSPRSNSGNGSFVLLAIIMITAELKSKITLLHQVPPGYFFIHYKDFKRHVRKAIFQVVFQAIFRSYQIRFNPQSFTRKVFIFSLLRNVYYYVIRVENG